MTLNLVVPVGKIHFVFFDRYGAFREELIGEKEYARLTVPPEIWVGFKGMESPYSLLLNVSDIEHNPSEVERKNIDEIIYDWKKNI